VQNKKILAVIPARAGSKGVKHKNFKKLNGKHLIGYTLESAKKIKAFSKLIVSTDDPKIAAYAVKQGFEVPFFRPKSLSGDKVPMWKVLEHALKYFQKNGESFDAVCLLQPTVPFRGKNEINVALNLFSNTNADTVVAVTKVPDQFNPHWVFVKDKDGILKTFTKDSGLFTRRQSLPPVYNRNGSVYVIKSHVILNQNKIFGKKICGFSVENNNYVNIDTIEDWQKAVLIAKRLRGKEKK